MKTLKIIFFEKMSLFGQKIGISLQINTEVEKLILVFFILYQVQILAIGLRFWVTFINSGNRWRAYVEGFGLNKFVSTQSMLQNGNSVPAYLINITIVSINNLAVTSFRNKYP